MRHMLAILAMVLTAAAAATDLTDQQIFQEFLGWYKTYTGSFAPPEVAKAYESKLKESGVAPAEAQRRIGVLQKLVSTMPREFAALHFDRIYRMPNPPFKAAASQFLVRMVEGRKPGKALDVAMGQGRNSHYLATQGWDVTGYDISEGGLAQARQLAEKAGLKIRTVTASHEEFDYGIAQWDLIVRDICIYQPRGRCLPQAGNRVVEARRFVGDRRFRQPPSARSANSASGSLQGSAPRRL